MQRQELVKVSVSFPLTVVHCYLPTAGNTEERSEK